MSALLLLLLLLGFVLGHAYGDVFSLIQKDQVERMARLVMRCGQIPGLSLSVVRGSSSWTLPLGVANVTSREPVTDMTKFSIGSLTKAFTSTLLVQLLRESPENYTTEVPLKTILGKNNLFSDDIRSNEATVKDILSHRVGVARADLSIFGGYPDDFTIEDVARSVRCLPVQKSFRDSYIYNNFMYSLAGHVIERLSNQSYADAMKTRLLGPMRMTSTLTSYNISDPYDGMAEPYLYLNKKLSPAHHSMFRLKPFMPAFGMASHAKDMTKWLQLQLGRGVMPSGETIVQRGVIEATHQPVTPNIINNLKPRFPQPDLTFAYGLGWHQAVYKGFRRVWHAGTLFGYTSQIWMLPDINIALFIAVNGPAKAPDTKNRISALMYYITDLLLGDLPWINPSTACSYPLPSPMQRSTRLKNNFNETRANQDQVTSSSDCNDNAIDIEKYTGIYYNKLFGNVTVSTDISQSSEIICVKLKILFGQRFKGLLKPVPNDTHLFEMEPVGIYEFSGHPSENEISTMPVELSDFDTNGVPYLLRAVWQPDEVIEFGRGLSDDSCILSHLFGKASSLRASMQCLLYTLLCIFYFQ